MRIILCVNNFFFKFTFVRDSGLFDLLLYISSCWGIFFYMRDVHPSPLTLYPYPRKIDIRPTSITKAEKCVYLILSSSNLIKLATKNLSREVSTKACYGPNTICHLSLNQGFQCSNRFMLENYIC